MAHTYPVAFTSSLSQTETAPLWEKRWLFGRYNGRFLESRFVLILLVLTLAFETAVAV